MRHRLAQQAGPVIAGHRCRLEPAAERLALGRANKASLALPADARGPVGGVDRVSPTPPGPLAPGSVEEGITNRSGESSQHARPDEEPAELGRQLVEDIARQVLAGQPRPAAERGEDAAPLLRRLAARREVEQLEAGGPPLGAAGGGRRA